MNRSRTFGLFFTAAAVVAALSAAPTAEVQAAESPGSEPVAAEDTSNSITEVLPAGAKGCYIESVPTGTAGTLRRANCSELPTGLNVRLAIVLNGDTDWSATGESKSGWSVPLVPGDTATLQWRVDPTLAGIGCMAELRERAVPWEYDYHGVAASCSAVPVGVQVRGKLDFYAQADVHTEWITSDRLHTTYESPLQQRTAPGMPTLAFEYLTIPA